MNSIGYFFMNFVQNLAGIVGLLNIIENAGCRWEMELVFFENCYK